MEKVCLDHAPGIITRKNKPAVVMMSLEDYQAMEETAYLLRSPANARHLLASIAALEISQTIKISRTSPRSFKIAYPYLNLETP